MLKIDKNIKGSSLTMSVGLVMLLMVSSAAVNELIIRNIRTVNKIEASNRAFYSAETALEDALYELSVHSYGYTTEGRTSLFSDTAGNSWRSTWSIKGMSETPETGEPRLKGYLAPNQKLIIPLYKSATPPSNPSSSSIVATQESQAIESAVDFSSITFLLPESEISLLEINNDRDDKTNEDGASQDKAPGSCPNATLRDADCDNQEDEDSAEDPVVYWKIIDENGNTLMPQQGCINTQGGGSELCESKFAQGRLTLLSSTTGINQKTGNPQTISDFFSDPGDNEANSASQRYQLEFSIIAPLINEADKDVAGNPKVYSHLNYEVIGGALPTPYFTLEVNGFYNNYRQSILTTLLPQTSTPLLDFTIVQQSVTAYVDNRLLPSDVASGDPPPLSGAQTGGQTGENTTPQPPTACTSDCPIAVDDAFEMLNKYSSIRHTGFNVDDPSSIDLLSNDFTNPATSTINIVSPPAVGLLTNSGNGIYLYDVPDDFEGTDSFTYNYTDATGKTSNNATVTLNVHLPVLAFITKTPVPQILENFEPFWPNGIQDADALCNTEAYGDNSLIPPGKTFAAWLSASDENADENAKDRIKNSYYPYITTNGRMIAEDYNNLLSGSLREPLRYTSSGEDLVELLNISGGPGGVDRCADGSYECKKVWTGTNQDGMRANQNCMNWSGRNNGAFGNFTSRAEWTNSGGQMTACNNPARFHYLYCFEARPAPANLGTLCGDSITYGPDQGGTEQCDDGNQDNTDDCTNACLFAGCGDTYAQTGIEECDDGNTTDGDGCSSACALEPGPSALNDTALVAGKETTVNSQTYSVVIDPISNDTSVVGINRASLSIIKNPDHGAFIKDASGIITYTPSQGYQGIDTMTYTVNDTLGRVSNVATITITIEYPKIAFLSSTTSIGSIGIGQMDAYCQGDAYASGTLITPGKNFKTWISTRSFNAKDRIIQSQIPYILPSGEKIADNFNDLIDGTIDNPINKAPNGTIPPVIAVSRVRTMTNEFGNFHIQNPGETKDCEELTQWQNLSHSYGYSTISNDPLWTNSKEGGIGCATATRTYCFEAPGALEIPDAVDDAIIGIKDLSINIDVLQNDSGTGLTFNSTFPIQSSLNGTISLNGNLLRYSPPVGLADVTDTFTYTIKNNQGTTDSATVYIELKKGRFVFVSSTRYNHGNLGGITWADNTCQNLANNAGIGATKGKSYKAWAAHHAQPNTLPGSRFTNADLNEPFVRLDGTIIANNWTDLVDGSLAAPISFTESGIDTYSTAYYQERIYPIQYAFTGIEDNGTAAAGSCDGLTAWGITKKATLGATNQITNGWSHWQGTLYGWPNGGDGNPNCSTGNTTPNNPVHLYCFEDTP